MAQTYQFRAILKSSYNILVEYDCDFGGKLLNTTGILGANIWWINPVRCRGYYYDTGLYCLNSSCISLRVLGK